MTPLPRVVGGWQCLLADPPWRFKSFDGKSTVPTQGADPYETMTLDDLMDMNVRGFNYVTDLFIWDKEKIGMGYHTRKQAELCLLFKRGKGLPVKSHSVRQIIRAPKREHSRKPDEQYDALDALYGTDLRQLELFARQQRQGWTAWGLEASKFGAAA